MSEPVFNLSRFRFEAWASEPICNGCYNGSAPSRCTRTSCPHHATCSRCGKDTSGRFIVAGAQPPRARARVRAASRLTETV